MGNYIQNYSTLKLVDKSFPLQLSNGDLQFYSNIATIYSKSEIQELYNIFIKKDTNLKLYALLTYAKNMPNYAKRKLKKCLKKCFLNFSKFLKVISNFDIRQTPENKAITLFNLFNVNTNEMNLKRFVDFASFLKFLVLNSGSFRERLSANIISDIDSSRDQLIENCQNLKIKNLNLKMFMDWDIYKIEKAFDAAFIELNLLLCENTKRKIIVQILCNFDTISPTSKWCLLDLKWWINWQNCVKLSTKNFKKMQKNPKVLVDTDQTEDLTNNISFKKSEIQLNNEKNQTLKIPNFVYKTNQIKPPVNFFILPPSKSTFSYSYQPGPISNKLVASSNMPTKGTFVIIPKPAWNRLQFWYKGGPMIEISPVEFKGKYFLDLDLFTYQFWTLKDNKIPLRKFSINLSDYNRFEDLVNKIQINDEKKKVHKMWIWFQPREKDVWLPMNVRDAIKANQYLKILAFNSDIFFEIKENKKKSAEHFFKKINSKIKFEKGYLIDAKINEIWQLSEIKDVKGSKVMLIPFGTNVVHKFKTSDNVCSCKVSSCFCQFKLAQPFTHSKNSLVKSIPGQTGLKNLGNTCYMNAALQCLSHTPYLIDYFVNERYIDDISQNDKFDEKKTALAREFSDLLKNLWSGQHEYFKPLAFKFSLDQNSRLFEGYQQHDTHEFLIHLLDELHECLKTNKLSQKETKPYFNKDNAMISTHQDKSMISNLFYGMLRSELNCNSSHCVTKSSTVEPFAYLSLSLPDDSFIALNLVVIDAAMETLKLNLSVSKSFSIKKLLDYVAKRASLRRDCVYAAQMINKACLKRVLMEADSIAMHINEKLVVYEVIEHTPHMDIEKNDDDESLFNHAQNAEKTKENSINLCSKDTFPQLDRKIRQIKAIKSCSDIVNLEKFELIKMNSMVRRLLQWRENWCLNGWNDSYYGSCKFSQIVQFCDKKFIMTPLMVVYSYKNTPNDLLHYSENQICKTINKNPNMSLFQKGVSFEIYLINDQQQQYPLNSAAANQNDSISQEFQMENVIIVVVWTASAGKLMTRSVKTPRFTELSEAKLNYRSISRFRKFINRWINRDSIGKSLPEANLESFRGKNSDLKKTQSEKNSLNKQSQKTLSTSLNKIMNFQQENEYSEQITERSVSKTSSFHKKVTKAKLSLYDSLNFFTREEILRDGWLCPKCGSCENSSKKILFYQMPSVLIIHLKRFNMFSDYGETKLNRFVDFPIENLNLTRYMFNGKEPVVYDLFAVANHYGHSCTTGHYTAYVRNFKTKKWTYYNDENCTEVQSTDVVSKYAYVLFYFKRERDDN